jgi:drug/metabolite transporter (DMT)-like permease
MAAVFTLTPGHERGLRLAAAGAGDHAAHGAGAWRSARLGALWVIFRADLALLALGFEVGRGESIYFWGCVAHALYSPLLRRFNRGEPALGFTAMIVTAGAVILGLWSARDLLSTDWRGLPGLVWGAAVYVGLMATALTFLILRFATLRLPSAKVMAYTYLVPSCVILWELALGRGVPSGMVLPGVALTVLSLLLLLKDEEAGPQGKPGH